MEEVKIPITIDDSGFGTGAKRIIDRMEDTQKEVNKTGMSVDYFAKHMQEVYRHFDKLAAAVHENTAAIGKDSQATRQLGRDFDETANKGVSGFGRLEKAAIGFFTIQKAKEFVGNVYDVRSEIEKLETSFRILVGDKAKADALFASIRKFAVETPMQLKDLAGAAQTMMGFGIATEDVMENLQALGDISMGDSQKFQSLALAFSQMSATGKLMGQDFLQMVNAGFNPLDQMAKTTGKSVAELKDEMLKGSISADMVRQAFMDATSEGGKFNGMLEAQSKTLAGAYSNLQGAIDDMLNEIGQKSEGAFATAIEGATDLVKNYEKVASVIQDLIVAYGSYKVALMVCNAAEKASVGIKQAMAVQEALLTAEAKKLAAARGISLAAAKAELGGVNLLTVAKIRLTAATKSLTAAMALNPYVAAAVAIAGLCFGIYKLATAEGVETAARRKANEEMQTFADKLDEQKSKIRGYIQTIQDETATEYQKAEAWEMLNKMAPTLTEKYDKAAIATLDLAEATNELNEQADKANYEHVRDEVMAWSKKLEELRSRYEKYQKMADDGSVDVSMAPDYVTESQLKAAEAQLDSYLKKLAEIDRIRAKMAEDNKPLEIRIQEANENAEAKAEIYDFYKRAADLAGELKSAHDAAAGVIANSSIPYDYDAIASQTKEKYDALIAELEEDVEGLRTRVAESPASLKLKEELEGKEQALNDLLQMKREWAWSGATTIPLTFEWDFSQAEKALRDAQSGAGKNTGGMKWVTDHVSKAGGHWEKDEAHADTRTAAQWRQQAYGNWKKAKKAVDDFWLKKESMDKAAFDKEYDRLKGIADKAKKDYDKLKGDKSSTSKKDSAAREEATRRQKQFEQELGERQRQAEQREAMEDALSAAAIAGEENRARRELMQAEKDHKDALAAIDRQAEEMRRANYEAEKKAWEASNTDKTTVWADTATAKDVAANGFVNIELTEEQLATLKALREKENAEYGRLVKERFETERQSLLDYMKEYGSIQDQKAAIAEEYDRKIADEGNAVQRAALQRQKEQALEELNFREWQQSIDWEAVFNDMERQSTSALESLKEKLRSKLTSGDVTAENAKVLSEKIREIEDLLSQRKDPFAAWLPGLRTRLQLTNQIKEAEEKIAGLQSTSDKQRADLLSLILEKSNMSEGAFRQQFMSELSADDFESILQTLALTSDEVTVALTNYKAAVEGTTDAQKNLKQRQEALENFTKGGDIAQYFKDITAGLDFGGMANLVNTNVQSMSDLVDNIGLGSTEFGEGVHEFAEGVGGFNNAIQALASGDVIGAVNGIVAGFQGFGKLFERIGGFSFNGSNAAEINRQLNRLSDRNEILTKSIDRLNDTMSGQGGSKAIETYAKMAELQKELEENLQEQVGLQMSYHNSHHSFGYYWDGFTAEQLSAFNRLNDFAEKWNGDLKSLTPEIAAALMADADMWQAIKETGEGSYGARVAERIEALAEQAGVAKEQVDALNASLTAGTTSDSVYDDFLESLYALADGSEDVMDDIADNWQKMVNRMVINNLVGEQFRENLEQWYADLANLNKAREGYDENGKETAPISDDEYKLRLAEIESAYAGYVEAARREIEQFTEAGIINPIEEASDAASDAFSAISDAFKEMLLDMEGDAEDFGKKIKETLFEALVERFVLNSEGYQKMLDEYSAKINEIVGTMSPNEKADGLRSLEEQIGDYEAAMERIRQSTDSTVRYWQGRYDNYLDKGWGYLLAGKREENMTDEELSVYRAMQVCLEQINKARESGEAQIAEYAAKIAELRAQLAELEATEALTDEERAAKIAEVTSALEDQLSMYQKIVQTFADMTGWTLEQKIDASALSGFGDELQSLLSDTTKSVEDWKQEIVKMMTDDLVKELVFTDAMKEQIRRLQEMYVYAMTAGEDAGDMAKLLELVGDYADILDEAGELLFDLSTVEGKESFFKWLSEQIAGLASDAKATADEVNAAMGTIGGDGATSAFDNLRDTFLDTLTDMESDAETFRKKLEQTLVKDLIEKQVLDVPLTVSIDGEDKVFDSFDKYSEDWNKRYLAAVESGNTALADALLDELMQVYGLTMEQAETLRERLREASDTTFKDMAGDWTSALMVMENTGEDWAEEIGKTMAQKIINQMIVAKKLQPYLDSIQEVFDKAFNADGATPASVIAAMTPAIEEAKIAFDEMKPVVDAIMESLGVYEYTSPFDNLRSSLLSNLMDMESDVRDFGKDINNILTEAMVDKFVLGDRFDEQLESWKKEYARIMGDPDMDAEERASQLKSLRRVIEAYSSQMKDEAAAIHELMGTASYEDQTATMNMSDKATYEQMDEYLATQMGIYVATEQGNAVRQQILSTLQSMSGITSPNGDTVREIRGLISISNQYLLDIKNSNREMLNVVSMRLNEISSKLNRAI